MNASGVKIHLICLILTISKVIVKEKKRFVYSLF